MPKCGKYLDTKTNKLVECDEGCKCCKGPKSCDECHEEMTYQKNKDAADTELGKKKLTLKNGSCVPPKGYYEEGGKLYKCNEGCSTCDSFEVCTGCDDPYRLGN